MSILSKVNTNLIGIVVSLLSTNYLRTELHSIPCGQCPEPHEFELVTVRQVVQSNQVAVLREGVPELIELDDARPVGEERVTNHVWLAKTHLQAGVVRTGTNTWTINTNIFYLHDPSDKTWFYVPNAADTSTNTWTLKPTNRFSHLPPRQQRRLQTNSLVTSYLNP